MAGHTAKHVGKHVRCLLSMLNMGPRPALSVRVPHLKHQLQHIALKTTSSTNGILSTSSLLLQDGLEITELPVLVRRTDTSLFPFTNHIASLDAVRKASEQDVHFRLLLQNCRTVKQVFMLLEVPSEQVTANSAAFALQRLCQLQLGATDDIDSFVRTAVMNELCETVAKEIHTLSNDTILGLVRCYIKSDNYTQQYIKQVNVEIEKRIGDCLLSIVELCRLVEQLSLGRQLLAHSQPGKVDRGLVDNTWIHISNRYKEIDDSNLATVFSTMQYLLPQHKYLLRMLDRQIVASWWKLNPEDIATIMTSLVRMNHESVPALVSFGKWLFVNIHSVTDSQIIPIVVAYIRFRFSDANFMRALERYITAKAKTHIHVDVLAVAMEYCRQRRYISMRIMDTVAKHYEQNGSTYTPDQLVSCLRAFGQLNYLPNNETKIFMKVEEALSEHFGDLDPASATELLCSFVYLERYPINFIKKVFTPHFLAKIRGIRDESLRLKTSRYLLQFQSAIMLEAPKCRIPYHFSTDELKHSTRSFRLYKFQQDIMEMLASLVGANHFRQAVFLERTSHVIDFEVNRDKDWNPLSMTDRRSNAAHRFAILSMMPEHCCVNTRHPLGEYAMRTRHLQLMGYKVIEINYDIYQRQASMSARCRYLRQKLKPLFFKPSQS